MNQKILVFSDSHGDYNAINSLALRFDTYDKIVFCGDVIADVADYVYPYRSKLVVVSGNCDYSSDAFPLNEEFYLGGIKFFVTHGHLFHAKYGTELLVAEAIKRQASVVLYGHTHLPLITEDCGITLINGGALKGFLHNFGSYAEVEIKDKIILPKIIKNQS